MKYDIKLWLAVLLIVLIGGINFLFGRYSKKTTTSTETAGQAATATTSVIEETAAAFRVPRNRGLRVVRFPVTNRLLRALAQG